MNIYGNTSALKLVVSLKGVLDSFNFVEDAHR